MVVSRWRTPSTGVNNIFNLWLITVKTYSCVCISISIPIVCLSSQGDSILQSSFSLKDRDRNASIRKHTGETLRPLTTLWRTGCLGHWDPTQVPIVSCQSCSHGVWRNTCGHWSAVWKCFWSIHSKSSPFAPQSLLLPRMWCRELDMHHSMDNSVCWCSYIQVRCWLWLVLVHCCCDFWLLSPCLAYSCNSASECSGWISWHNGARAESGDQPCV